MEDFSAAETAEILNWSTTRVNVTVHRAIKKVRAVYEENEGAADLAAGKERAGEQILAHLKNVDERAGVQYNRYRPLRAAFVQGKATQPDREPVRWRQTVKHY